MQARELQGRLAMSVLLAILKASKLTLSSHKRVSLKNYVDRPSYKIDFTMPTYSTPERGQREA